MTDTITPLTHAERLLIVDDDTELCELLREYLRKEGYESEAVHSGIEGLQRSTSGDFALVILDVMLPDLNGFDVLRRLRQVQSTPVLMLTARGEDIDRIVGLEIGADDYLPKPFNPRELIARIRAILRRASSGSAVLPGVGREPRIVVDDVELDPGARTVHCRGQALELTSTEFDLLAVLLRSAGRAVSREELSRIVFGRRLLPEDRSIDVHISNLRRKLGHQAHESERIKTIRGTGYIYVLPTEGAGPGISRSDEISDLP